MEQVDHAQRVGVSADGEEVVDARIGRWVAQDRAAILERRLAEMREELAGRDDRLRRLTDEWLLERERRQAAEGTVHRLLSEATAMRNTLWWRLGRIPRRVRRYIR